ncbi:MAG: hypothetical protein BGP10_13215 [Rhodanobacter sp. 68-29]|nr:ParA family protein [Rhodanobacter sp.]ODU92200.1 MAG: hypothetical protein ABT18_13050 [Rhodanobacter sp. SCN 66-43]OJY58284.1 MAG: hypothetical protein BGP10_13215 [Rhodanobacter sp. 68-29]
MQAIHIFSSKGGSGKTTAALSLAAALAHRGHRVALVDADPNGAQGGATRWLAQAQAAGRATPFPVLRSLTASAAKAYDVVIWDHPPGGRAAHQLPEGLVIVPTPLDPGSFFSATRVVDSLRHRSLTPLLLPSRVRLERAEQRRLAGVLAVPVIRDRAAYGSLFGQGTTLYSDATGIIGQSAARAEFEETVARVLAHLSAGRTKEAA